MNRYTARLLVGDADWSIPLLGRPNAIIHPSREGADTKRTTGEWVCFGMVASLFVPKGMVANKNALKPLLNVKLAPTSIASGWGCPA